MQGITFAVYRSSSDAWYVALQRVLDNPIFSLRAKKPLHTGVRTGCHYLICLLVCVRVCVTFVVFTDCESCTRPISTNSVSMEAGEYELTHGTWAFARRLEVVTVARLRWTWCVFGGEIFFSFLGYYIFKFVDPEQLASTQ